MKLVILSTLCLLAVSAPLAAQEILPAGNGVIAPSLVHEVKPAYPPEVMRKGIGGTVRMTCVVRPDGTASDIRVVEPLEPTLDAAAVAALQQWQFKAGTKDGKAVPVRVEIEMSFTTRQTPRFGSPDVFKEGPGITLPTATGQKTPDYTPAARAAGIQGSVQLECVVLSDGTVGDVRVVKPLDPELDDQAVRTLKGWHFTPGRKDGRTVAVQVEVEMTFALR